MPVHTNAESRESVAQRSDFCTMTKGVSGLKQGICREAMGNPSFPKWALPEDKVKGLFSIWKGRAAFSAVWRSSPKNGES